MISDSHIQHCVCTEVGEPLGVQPPAKILFLSLIEPRYNLISWQTAAQICGATSTSIFLQKTNLSAIQRGILTTVKFSVGIHTKRSRSTGCTFFNTTGEIIGSIEGIAVKIRSLIQRQYMPRGRSCTVQPPFLKDCNISRNLRFLVAAKALVLTFLLFYKRDVLENSAESRNQRLLSYFRIYSRF